jgi:hypothetical protein
MIYDIFVNCNWVDTRWQWYSTHLHINNTQNNTINNKTLRITNKITQTTNLEECWPCPVFASFTLAFALHLREKHGKTSVRVAEEISLKYAMFRMSGAIPLSPVCRHGVKRDDFACTLYDLTDTFQR